MRWLWRISGIHHAYEDADLFGFPQIFRRITSIFYCMVARFQKYPLLRVHAFGFFRCNLEKQRIELINTFYKTTPFCIYFPRLAFLRVKILFPIPSIPGYLSNAIDATG